MYMPTWSSPRSKHPTMPALRKAPICPFWSIPAHHHPERQLLSWTLDEHFRGVAALWTVSRCPCNAEGDHPSTDEKSCGPVPLAGSQPGQMCAWVDLMYPEDTLKERRPNENTDYLWVVEFMETLVYLVPSSHGYIFLFLVPAKEHL